MLVCEILSSDLSRGLNIVREFETIVYPAEHYQGHTQFRVGISLAIVDDSKTIIITLNI